MGYTLEQLSSTCRDILTADRGPEGRKQVCAVIRDVLLDTAFTETYLVDGGPERKILYEIPSSASASSPTSTRARRKASPTITGRPGRSTARRRERP